MYQRTLEELSASLWASRILHISAKSPGKACRASDDLVELVQMSLTRAATPEHVAPVQTSCGLSSLQKARRSRMQTSEPRFESPSPRRWNMLGHGDPALSG
ncbi:hypothetical protein AcW1_004716 [Taiwanofungus camphoratus]|nr:hypothetical protein AcW1_004716 [Antrodia cinnamomea]